MNSYLLIKLAAAGDVLLFTAALRELRRCSPDAHIAWLTSAYAAPLLEHNPDLDELLVVDALVDRWRAASEMSRLLRRWKHAHPQGTVILAHRAVPLAALCRLAGLRKIIRVGRSVPFEITQHRLARNAALLHAAGLPADPSASPRFELTPADRAWADTVWPTPARQRFVMAPGGAANPWSQMPNRRWPRERFLDLALRARAEGAAVSLIGGRDDAAVTALIAQQAPGTLDLAGRLSLRKTAALIASATLFIGIDSLPLVIAHAVNTPALGLFGPTDGSVIHAGPGKFVQGQVGCGPCYDPRDGLHGRAYRCPRALCMESITAAQVWNRATQLNEISTISFSR